MVVTSGRVGYGGGGGLFISTAVRGVTLEGCAVSCEATAVIGYEIVLLMWLSRKARIWPSENRESKLKVSAVSCTIRKATCKK